MTKRLDELKFGEEKTQIEKPFWYFVTKIEKNFRNNLIGLELKKAGGLGLESDSDGDDSFMDECNTDSPSPHDEPKVLLLIENKVQNCYWKDE